MVEEIIQRGLVWTFEMRVWWMLTVRKLVNKSAPKGDFEDFFENILKIFSGCFSGFLGVKKGSSSTRKGFR